MNMDQEYIAIRNQVDKTRFVLLHTGCSSREASVAEAIPQPFMVWRKSLRVIVWGMKECL